jgi:hypothetical protein
MTIERRRFIASGIFATTALGVLGVRDAIGQSFDPNMGRFDTTPPKGNEQEKFRNSAQAATAREGFVGAFPNFYTEVYGPASVAGTIFIKRNDLTKWMDVLLTDLEKPSLSDFGQRFRATQDYANRRRKEGFVGGFPNFFHADYGGGIVCGTILLKAGGAEWRDVPLSELGANVSLDDIGQRFRATHDYAKRINEGFVGGFPNFYHANYGKGIVCGTILLRENVAEWQDVTVSVVR